MNFLEEIKLLTKIGKETRLLASKRLQQKALKKLKKQIRLAANQGSEHLYVLSGTLEWEAKDLIEEEGFQIKSKSSSHYEISWEDGF